MGAKREELLPVVRVAEISCQDRPQRWLVDQLWGTSSVGLIGGAPKCSKTWLGLDLALSVATGTSCLGKYAVPEAGPVLVYLAEDALPIVRQRVEGMARHRGLNLQQVEIHVITAPTLRLDREQHRGQLLQTAQRLRPRLLLLDPLPSGAIRAGYIIPSDQPDFATATRFANSLIASGIVFHRATASFQVAGKTYPAGSYVVKTAQAFRPHILDMFEPQDHPDDIPYPGGPPRPPYDATGWTLAYQMGVRFDRVLDAFDGPFEKLPLTPIKIPTGTVAPAKAAVGYLVSHQTNDSFTATNKLLAAKEDVYWLKAPFTAAGKTYPAGTLYIPAKPTTRAAIEKVAGETGVTVDTTAVRPTSLVIGRAHTRCGYTH